MLGKGVVRKRSPWGHQSVKNRQHIMLSGFVYAKVWFKGKSEYSGALCRSRIKQNRYLVVRVRFLIEELNVQAKILFFNMIYNKSVYIKRWFSSIVWGYFRREFVKSSPAKGDEAEQVNSHNPLWVGYNRARIFYIYSMIDLFSTGGNLRNTFPHLGGTKSRHTVALFYSNRHPHWGR